MNKNNKKRIIEKTINLEKIRSVFVVLILTIIFLVFSYTYFINKTVFNTTERQNLEKELSSLSVKTGELEFKYISMKNDIDFEIAESLGFSNTSEAKFITRRSLGQVFTLGQIQ